MTVQLWDNIFAIILLMVMIYFVLAVIFKNVFNRVYLSNHRGTLRSADTLYLVAINFKLNRDCLCYSSVESFTLLYPLRVKQQRLIDQSIIDFYVLNEQQSWFIKNNQFSLAERVLCKGTNTAGEVKYEYSAAIAFSLDSIIWNTSRENMIKSACYGDCTVRIVRNPKSANEESKM